MDYKGVIFDFNGTLFFDNDKHVLAWNKISNEIRGHDISDEELHDKFNGVPNAKIIDYLLDGKASSKDVDKYSKLKEQYYREFCQNDQETFHLVKGSYQYFDYLKSNNIPFTIASASIKENIDFFVKSFNLDKYFDVNKIIYDDGSYENKIAMFKDAARVIDTDIEDILVFEDSLSGIKNASSAGVNKIVIVNNDDYANLPGVILTVDNLENVNNKL